MTAPRRYPNPFDGIPDEWIDRAITATEEAMARSEARGDQWHSRVGLGSLRMLVGEQTRRARTKERAA